MRHNWRIEPQISMSAQQEPQDLQDCLQCAVRLQMMNEWWSSLVVFGVTSCHSHLRISGVVV